MGVMSSPDPSIDSEVMKILSASEAAQVLAILRSHRRRTIAELPPGAAAVAGRIVRDARLRHHTFGRSF